jgi:hypothetical protein
MKIAYLILAHDNPRHLHRLTRALAPSSSSIFIHIDRKSDLRDFNDVCEENVRVLEERVPVYWGDFSQVEATLRLLKTALAEHPACDYFILLSGTHYPIQPSEYIKAFFEREAGHEFINAAPMGTSISRLINFTPRPWDPVTLRLAFKIAKLIRMPLVRNYSACFGSLVPYYGSAYWSLTRGACQYIQNFVSEEKSIVNFFENTRCPDESFFQTILNNSGYASRIARSVSYEDWSAGGSSPAILTERNLSVFEGESAIIVRDSGGPREALFARKFSDFSDEVLYAIDRQIRERDAAFARTAVEIS